MGKEFWIWIKERAGAVLRWISRWGKRGWLALSTFIRGLSTTAWKRIAISAPLVFFLYIFIGVLFVHRIDVTPANTGDKPAGGAEVIEVVAALVEREAVQNRWTPNDPLIMPGWWIDNTPNFQRGIIHALSRVSLEFRDQLGRTRGSSASDSDLETAAGNLAKEPDRWVINFETSLLPTTASEVYYKEAVKQLREYNARLAAGVAVFERRNDNLLATLDRIALDLGDASATADALLAKSAGGFLPDTEVDDVFYNTKGRIFAYGEILKALQVDFADVIEGREISTLYIELLKSIDAAVSLDPWIVTNGSRDGVLANHLASQGFHLLRARTQLREITNILLK